MALTADRANYAAIKSDQVAVLQVASSGKPLGGDVWGQELRFAADDLETVTAAGGVARETVEAATRTDAGPWTKRFMSEIGRHREGSPLILDDIGNGIEVRFRPSADNRVRMDWGTPGRGPESFGAAPTERAWSLIGAAKRLRAIADEIVAEGWTIDSSVVRGNRAHRELYRAMGMEELDPDGTLQQVSLVRRPPAGGVARETGETAARTVVGETAPTLDAFTEMAGRGKLHPATGRDLPGEATATNPFEFGVINGYSEDDIAHFYLALRAPWNKARTAKNVGAVRDDMRELAYEQFLEDRAEYVAKQSGAPLGSVHRQLSDEIGKADVVRGESGEMMLEVDDVEAFDAALKAWEEANPVTPFTEAMERLDPPAAGD